jgi:hypothetical protein
VDGFPAEVIARLRFERDWCIPERPLAIRARLLLKAILRGHHVRCIDLEDGAGRLVKLDAET